MLQLQGTSSRARGLQQLWLLGSSFFTGLTVVAHGFRCSAACGIFPDQGLNPCLLHWQAYSLPLNHQRSPVVFFSCLLGWLWVGKRLVIVTCRPSSILSVWDLTLGSNYKAHSTHCFSHLTGSFRC